MPLKHKLQKSTSADNLVPLPVVSFKFQGTILSALLLFVPSSACSAFACQRRTMGLAASIVPKEESVEINKNKGERRRPHVVDEWKRVVEDFTAQVLDPTYLTLPVRASTVEAAALYPASPDDSMQKNYLMPGTHKHLGGAYDPTDGCIYGVPANSKSILCLYPDGTDGYKMTTIPLPEQVADTHYKWLRGIFAHGYLWAIPSWADSVLCVNVDAFWGRRPTLGENIVQLLPLPPEHAAGLTWQWHGAGINREKTAIYCIPSNAKTVLKVNLLTKTTVLIPIENDETQYPNFCIDISNKWYGGILGQDNAVYGVPYRSCAVLRIDCATDTAALVGPDYGCAGYNWHGGLQVNGKIYAHPSHAPDSVLVIDTNPDRVGDKNICSELKIRRADYDTDTRENYKWLGGSIGADGNIYCPACDASAVLKIDTTTNECTTFGFAGTLKNKWQGGILARDECIYCIPASGRHVLRIATSPGIQGENPIQLVGEVPAHKDKWQGGHVGKDGCLYFIPENGYRVLKVTPPKKPPAIVDGKMPAGDVKVEMM
jgi:hypothetical protein